MVTTSFEPRTSASVKAKHTSQHNECYHCGTACLNDTITADEKVFCCEGCKLVYELLNENGLCDYYKIQQHPGLLKVNPLRSDKYAYLENEEIAKRLYKFTDGNNCIVTFYLPGVHCSSCLWLLEHLSKFNPGIAESRLNFTAKEITVRFSKEQISVRQLVELLAKIGYEPYISLNDGEKKTTPGHQRKKIFRLGVAGFCFGNIMMLSFPEYLSHATGIDPVYAHLFRFVNLALSLPVFFYSAGEFFSTAWKGIQQKILNIDAPIALAIIIAFARSIYEITSGTGAGYLDSMSGIVFFMLVGRLVQERTYGSISFHRDYKSYFPIAVTVVTPAGTETRNLQDLKEKDVVKLHNEEIIPADAILVSGNACVDYSFVTGESEPVPVAVNSMLYAGGKQKGEQIIIQIVKPVAGSYLTSLWNHSVFAKNKAEKNDESSIIHVLSRYFTWILFGLTALTAIVWMFIDPSKVLTNITAMLIVACPCALLLCVTFTNGNLMRIFSNNGLFLRDATVIEQLNGINHVVFDKTGTLTQSGNKVAVSGHQLNENELNLVYSAAASSTHPMSKAIISWLGMRTKIPLDHWQEEPGKGIAALSGNTSIKIGSRDFVQQLGASTTNSHKTNAGAPASVYIAIDNNITAVHFNAVFRDAVTRIIPQLNHNYKLSVLSGDNNAQEAVLKDIFGSKANLNFNQKPMDKLKQIEELQASGAKVAMIGDGLNDAGALQQSNVGITLSDDINNFTPSCDAILDAKRLKYLPALLHLGKISGHIIGLSFFISICYNIVGLYFAATGRLQPMTAAILMPCSTISIVIIATGVTGLVAKRLGLSLKVEM
jgi:P-type Cu+ transporter